MPHFTILKEGVDPLDVFTLTECSSCSAGCHAFNKNYHCPICPPSKFNPKSSEELVLKHLQLHFTAENKYIPIKGYRIAICHHPCQEGSKKADKQHYHCPFCPEISGRKIFFLKHIELHSKSETVSARKGRRSLLSSTGEGLPMWTAEVKNLNNNISTMESPCREKAEVKKVTINAPLHKLKSAHSIITNYKQSGNRAEFKEIMDFLSSEGDSAAILSWITQMTECATMLDKKADELVLSFLKMPLFTSEKLANATCNFIRVLVSRHNYYAYYILKVLFDLLVPGVDSHSEELLVSAGSLSKEDDKFYERIISAIILINSDIPMTQENLQVLAKKTMPFFKIHVHKHAVYAQNLLLLASYLPHLRLSILEVIIVNMITIDVHVSRSELAEEQVEDDLLDSSDEEDMFDMELDDLGKHKGSKKSDQPLDACQVPKPMTHKDGNSLDVLMSIMLQYVHNFCHGIFKPTAPLHLRRTQSSDNSELGASDCRPGSIYSGNFDAKRMGGCECGGSKHDVDGVKQLYSDLKNVFSTLILRTHASSHVQFLLFYIVSLRPGLVSFFADFLINKKFKDPNSSQCIRKNAMAYAGSLLARGKHVSFLEVHACLEAIRDWCNEYLDFQERLPERNYEDMNLHGSFYSACQTLFYVFTFRYKQYTDNKKTLSLARSLNFDRFIHSRLNPLHVCSPPVVSNFAAVAQHFQIAYCYTIIENNKRLEIPSARMDLCDIEPQAKLDGFFPFDPYFLNRSKLYIQNHYREFEGLPEDMVIGDNMEMDAETPSSIISQGSFDMSAASPGFVTFSRITEENLYS